MGQAIVALITVGLMVYALVDCARTEDHEVRSLPRPLWFVVILVPLVGGIAWLVYGAPRGSGALGPGSPRVVAPDDDPDFLRSLEQKARERRRVEREERRRQAKEQRREEKEARREEKRGRDSGDAPSPD